MDVVKDGYSQRLGQAVDEFDCISVTQLHYLLCLMVTLKPFNLFHVSQTKR